MSEKKTGVAHDYENVMKQTKSQPGVAEMLEMLELIDQPNKIMTAYKESTNIPARYISTASATGQ